MRVVGSEDDQAPSFPPQKTLSCVMQFPDLIRVDSRSLVMNLVDAVGMLVMIHMSRPTTVRDRHIRWTTVRRVIDGHVLCLSQSQNVRHLPFLSQSDYRYGLIHTSGASEHRSSTTWITDGALEVTLAWQKEINYPCRWSGRRNKS